MVFGWELKNHAIRDQVSWNMIHLLEPVESSQWVKGRGRLRFREGADGWMYNTAFCLGQRESLIWTVCGWLID